MIDLRKRVLPLVLASLAPALISSPGCAQKIDREALLKDTRAIATTIEKVHPDPYTGGGGKVAFHRRLQETMRGIPVEGMTVREYYFHLRPFVASVSDAHTWLRPPQMTNWGVPGGVPLFLWVVEESLYVRGVFNAKHSDLIGCRLAAVEGVPFDEIVRRAGLVISHDNHYQVLRNLCAFGQLFQGEYLRDLLPEWTADKTVTVTLIHPDGEKRRHVFQRPWGAKYPPMYIPSAFELPSTAKCDFAWDFIGEGRETALLVISGMMRYREALELWRSYGSTSIGERAGEAYERFHGKKPSRDLDETIAGVPSATEVFRDLVMNMKDAGTRTLIVDLRDNGGGNSLMSQILVYFLYGRRGLAATMEQGSEIVRYSQAYFDRNTDTSIEQVNEGRDIPLETGDYDFIGDHLFSGSPSDETKFANFEEFVVRMPTFRREYDSGDYEAHYLPEKVLVLSSHDTFSSGFTLLRYLSTAGAEVVGTPSAQAANCYGDILDFELEGSGLGYTVSRKQYVLFRDDGEKGRVLMPEHLLTYEKLRKYGFDRNAEIMFAIEIAGGSQR